MPRSRARIAVQQKQAPHPSAAQRGGSGAMRGKLTLELPLPPAEYATNHSSGKAWYQQRGKRGAKEAAYAAVLEAAQAAGWRPGQQFRQPRLRVTFCLPNHIRRDHDGLVQRMKPYFDALSEPQGQKNGLGIIKDDNLEVIGFPEYRHIYGKPGYTLIEIEEGDTQ